MMVLINVHPYNPFDVFNFWSAFQWYDASIILYVILLVCETILQYERYIKKFYLSGTPNAAYIC